MRDTTERSEGIEAGTLKFVGTDEIFLQTFAMLSPCRNKIVNNSLRYIDWKHGNPYVFTEKDYDELSKMDRLFARKFDERASGKVTEKIQANLLRVQEI